MDDELHVVKAQLVALLEREYDCKVYVNHLNHSQEGDHIEFHVEFKCVDGTVGLARFRKTVEGLKKIQ
jgi:hypothetical protein